MRERWGAFSVRDHISEAPFVTEVLLYDRLVIPVPDPKNTLAETEWDAAGWQPELLHKCLDMLKVKTENEDGLALTVPWDDSKRKRFENRVSMAAALATQGREPGKPYYTDPFKLTQDLLADEFPPALPAGVSKAWTVAAYSSSDAFRRDASASGADRSTQLGTLLQHHFLTPTQSDPNQEVPKRAVDLSATQDYRKKRARFYEWQEKIIEEEISDEKAIEELEQLLSEYNE